MTDNPRIEDLRRRVQQDPASIAFAQLAEEYRRAGQCEESVEVCQAGLAIHPGYLSARVTLGRALLELGRLDQAQLELERVLKSAPENLAALRGLAEIYHRQGALAEALAQYKLALSLARNDPELEQAVEQLTRELAPPGRTGAESAAAPHEGVSLEEVARELAGFPPAQRPAPPSDAAPAGAVAAPSDAPAAVAASAALPTGAVPLANEATTPAADPPEGVEEPTAAAPVPAADDRAGRTVAALEQFLAAIHGSRPQRRP